MRLTILFIVAFTIIGCHHSKQSGQEFIGKWESVKFKGSDGGNFITSIEISFMADSTFHAIAFKADNSSDNRSGNYHVNSDSLTMVGNGETITQVFHFSGDTLILDDIHIDSRIYLIQD